LERGQNLRELTMLAYCASRISPHMGVMKNGALLCVGVPLARVGEQAYRGDELGLPTSDKVTVRRTPEEVFDAAALASFEGVPLTDQHPGTFITPSNFSWYARGHVQNVRRSADGRFVLGDIIVNDQSLITKIRSGVRDVSCGYDVTYIPLRDGTYMQASIRGNHVAVVPRGRAQTTRIMDAQTEEIMDIDALGGKLDRLIEILEAPRRPTSSGNKLVDEINAIVAGSRKVEELTASGVGPGEFARELAKHNSAYSEFSHAADEGQRFAEAARAEGLRMQDRYRPKSCTADAPVREHRDESADSWADAMNRAGRRLRGR
jgi:hypothetical protein